MRWKVVALVRNVGWPKSKEGYAEVGADYVEIPCQTEDEIVEAIPEADAVLSAAVENFDNRVIRHMHKCRIISVAATGYDHVNLNAATEHGICVSNIPEYCTEEVSDQAMALLLACAQKVLPQVVRVKAGKWNPIVDVKLRTELQPIFRIRGQILGIIGLGRIGCAVAIKARGFGIKVIAYDPYVDAGVARNVGVELVGLECLLEESDFVSLHMPLTNENRHMLGPEQFRMMKSTAFLINTARGSLIDECALYVALTQGYIAGAGLDVNGSDLPEPNNPLLKLENVLMTPHAGFYSEQSMTQLLQQSEEEIFRVLSGKWPQHLVNNQVKEIYSRRWCSGSML